MTRVLGLPHDLPLPAAELAVLVRDRVVVPVGPAHASIAEIDDAALRLRSLAHALPPGVVAARRTAAWVWGATGVLDVPVEGCVEARGRHARVVPGARLSEVLLAADDVVRDRHGRGVTTALRTVLDLLRDETWSEGDASLVGRLLDDHAIAVADVERRADAYRRLPHKIRALRRLHELAAAGPPRRPVPSVSPR